MAQMYIGGLMVNSTNIDPIHKRPLFYFCSVIV